jgi:hypothetical protein
VFETIHFRVNNEYGKSDYIEKDYYFVSIDRFVDNWADAKMYKIDYQIPISFKFYLIVTMQFHFAVSINLVLKFYLWTCIPYLYLNIYFCINVIYIIYESSLTPHFPLLSRYGVAFYFPTQIAHGRMAIDVKWPASPLMRASLRDVRMRHV